MNGRVIQGSFPHGVLRPAPVRAGTTRRSHPRSYDELAREAHQRGTRSAAQPAMRGRAFVLPSNLAMFGRRQGVKLAPAIQRKMESFFKHDFSAVEIHVGPEATAIGALAFTQGSHIYFAPGEYRPDTPAGQRLLGHELTHVVQQRAGRVRSPFGTGVAVVQDPQLEAEAERMALEAAAYRHIDAPVQRAIAGLGKGSAISSIVPAVERIVQRATAVSEPKKLTFKMQGEIEGLFRALSYPIGNKEIPALEATESKDDDGKDDGDEEGSSSKKPKKKKYDVGALAYDSKGNEIGNGKYTSGPMYHAEMVALDQAIAAKKAVAKIRVSKPSCRRCAIVFHLLGMTSKVGPQGSSSTAGGSYKIPDNVRAAVAARLPSLEKFSDYTIDQIAPVIEGGSWW